MRRIWPRRASMFSSTKLPHSRSLLCAPVRYSCAFCWALEPSSMASRLAWRLVCKSPRLAVAALSCFRSAFTERLTAARDSCDWLASLMVVRDFWFSCRMEVIWNASFSRVARASWIQSSRFDRRIRASKDEVG